MLRSTIFSLALAAGLTAQAPDCFTNLVPNGGFENLFPNAWVFSGSGTGNFPVTANVRGDGDSSALVVNNSGAYTLTQPTAFSLVAGQEYRISVDVLRSTVSFTLSATLVDAMGGTTSVLSRSVGDTGNQFFRTQVADVFVAPASGLFSLELNGTRSTGRAGQTFFDNIEITESGGPSFFITESFLRTGPANPNAYRIVGLPGDLTAVLISTGTGAPISVPGFGAVPLLLDTNVIITAVPPTFLDGAGELTGLIPISTAISGFRLAFQPLSINTLSFGCPTQIVF
ncbi:MAG: hypothetical protein AAF196_17670 [Planctomycetota bacterium]